MAAPSDVLIYVQHLLGIGHYRRTALIARAAARAGLRVVVASGGLPVANADLGGARLVQLEPPLKSRDEAFSGLATEDGGDLDEAQRDARRLQLLDLFRQARPRVLLTEMFPFGRRQMRFEVLPLLEAAQAAPWRPKIAASVRDILTTLKQPGKIAWIVETAQRYYDRVLVHGDPRLIPFERTFPEVAALGRRIAYTGYVVEASVPRHGRHAEAGEVLVSTGGGAVAEPLVRAVMAAHALSPLQDRTWRVLIGHNLSEAAFQAFRQAAAPGMVIERSRPDFLSLLAEAGLSISQAGYNTTLEVLACGVPAVVVPFAAGGESEQTLRARLLEEAGRLVVAEEEGLSGERLNAAISRALALHGGQAGDRGLCRSGAPAELGFSLEGAEETARLLADLAGRAETG